jgi:hypothetical protein
VSRPASYTASTSLSLHTYAVQQVLGRGHKRTLRRKLRAAKTWEEWKKAALEMDDYLGFNEWKEVSAILEATLYRAGVDWAMSVTGARRTRTPTMITLWFGR